MRIHHCQSVARFGCYSKKISQGFVAALLCLCLVLSGVFFNPACAQASILGTDSIMGETVDERSLPIAQCPDVAAAHVYVMTADGTELFARDAHTPVKIASVTKIMTALVALDYASLDEVLVVTDEAAKIGESSASLQAGDFMDMRTALIALMIPSGNDAALSIANYVGQKVIAAGEAPVLSDGSVASTPNEAFVALMNNKAAELNCSDTLFTNAHGLDSGEYAGNQHSTAADVTLMSAEAMKSQTLREIVSLGDTTITVTREGVPTEIALDATDLLLESYPYVIGIKTGFTDQAGNCFAGAANKDGYEVYATVLNSTSETQRFTDAQTLFEWSFNRRVSIPLVTSAETTTMPINGVDTTVGVVASVPHSDWVDATVKATAADPLGSFNVYDFNGNVSMEVVPNELTGNVKTGDVVGTINYYQHNKVVYSCDLIACEDQRAPSIFEMMGTAFDRFIRGFTGQEGTASTKVYATMTLLNDKSTA